MGTARLERYVVLFRSNDNAAFLLLLLGRRGLLCDCYGRFLLSQVEGSGRRVAVRC